MQNKELMKILATSSINKRNQQKNIVLLLLTSVLVVVAYKHFKNSSTKERQISSLLEEKENLHSTIRRYQSEIEYLNNTINKIVQDEAAKTLPVNNPINKNKNIS